MRPKSRTLTEQELEIMKVIWELESATVRRVHQNLSERRKIAYTTVMTMMKILQRKKYLSRTLHGKAYTYYPTRPKEEVLRSMVREFVERVFEGSAQRLLVCLVQDGQIDSSQLRQLADAGRRAGEAPL